MRCGIKSCGPLLILGMKLEPEMKPALTNLLGIFSAISGETIVALENKYQGSSYADFKKDLAEVLVAHLAPIQKKHDELMSDPAQIHAILDKRIETAPSISSK